MFLRPGSEAVSVFADADPGQDGDPMADQAISQARVGPDHAVISDDDAMADGSVGADMTVAPYLRPGADDDAVSDGGPFSQLRRFVDGGRAFGEIHQRCRGIKETGDTGVGVIGFFG